MLRAQHERRVGTRRRCACRAPPGSGGGASDDRSGPCSVHQPGQPRGAGCRHRTRPAEMNCRADEQWPEDPLEPTPVSERPIVQVQGDVIALVAVTLPECLRGRVVHCSADALQLPTQLDLLLPQPGIRRAVRLQPQQRAAPRDGRTGAVRDGHPSLRDERGRDKHGADYKSPLCFMRPSIKNTGHCS